MNARELAEFTRKALIDAGKLSLDPHVERGRHYPDVAPSLPGETDAQYTDRLTGADGTGRRPYDHDRNRYCSIGYHLKCSDPNGESCECPCHLDRIEGATTATDAASMLGRLYYLPITTAKNVMQEVRAKVMQRAVLGEPPDDSGEPPDHLSFEEVRDIIGETRPHYSRPGTWFTVDVLKVGGLDKFVRGMP